MTQSDNSFVLAQQETQAALATVEEWHALLKPFVITSDEQEQQVVGVIRDVKGRYKLLEDKRTEITGPLNQALRAVNDLFRRPKDKLEALERMLKKKLADYARQKAAVNVAALEAAARAPSPEVAQQSLAQVAPIVPPKGASIRRVWKFEITDANLVPRELCSPDPAKIKLVDPHTNVPGVRFYQEDEVAVRTR